MEGDKMKSPLKNFVILVTLFGLGGGVFFFWHQRKPAAVPTPLVVPPSVEVPEAPAEMPYETYTTADGNLSFEYPAAWTRTEIQNLETVLPKEFIDNYELTMPLILSDPRGAQASLSIYRFEKGMDLDAVMDALKAELVTLGSPYNEVSREMVGEALVVDSTADAQGVTVQVRDILFLASSEPKNVVYDLSFSARQSSWGEYETIFDHIQSSAQPSL